MLPTSASPSFTSDKSVSVASSICKAPVKKKRNMRNSRACSYCHHLKMKCSGPTFGDSCERCRKTGRECMEQERAPRRSRTVNKDRQIQILTDRLEEIEKLVKDALCKHACPVGATSAHVQGESDLQMTSGCYTAGSRPTGSSQHQSDGQLERDCTLLPSIDHPYTAEDDRTTGHSSGAIAHWLTLIDVPTKASAAYKLDLAYVDARRTHLPFVSSGKISSNDAVELFHICMNNCMLHTVILDPEWHTMARIGDASPFLFAVVVLIGSNYHQRRTLRAELQEEMNALIGQVVTTERKSVEVVQGFLLLYQWNIPSADPADDRAWLLAGIGIRLATELQLYKPPIYLRAEGNEKEIYSESDRERINRERCWLTAFLVDRSLSVAVGRPWSISEKMDLIQNSDKWSTEPASRAWDRGISALADLSKISSRQADVLRTATRGEGEQISCFDFEAIMHMMNDELEHWRSRWLSRDFYAMTAESNKKSAERSEMHRSNSVRYGTVGGEDSQQYQSASPPFADANTSVLDAHLKILSNITKQASLRYNFALLVLNSFGLQHCALRSDLKHIHLFCLTHALRASQDLLKAARNEMNDALIFAPQTVYTILSFGMISLLKLTSLIEKSSADRLIEEVQLGISHLESVATASDHIAARLASMLRGLLRRREDKNSMEARSARLISQLDHKFLIDRDREQMKASGEDEGMSSCFAPGLDVHELPKMSSRALTPNIGEITASQAHLNEMSTEQLLKESSQILLNASYDTMRGSETDLMELLQFNLDEEPSSQSSGCVTRLT